ncbi:MAG: hypothetical protein LAN59_03805 [Acidobacteriia bacterium]|nr:hypothetical protein [Terriglobia bacterium]
MNRRQLLSLLGISPAALAAPGALAEGPKGPAAGSGKIVTLNPKGTPPPVKLVPMAPRLASLDGKTVFLVDDGFPGADSLLHLIQRWFSQNMPGVTTVYRKKAGAYAEDDPALWKEIKAKGHACIMAIGH